MVSKREKGCLTDVYRMEKWIWKLVLARKEKEKRLVKVIDKDWLGWWTKGLAEIQIQTG